MYGLFVAVAAFLITGWLFGSWECAVAVGVLAAVVAIVPYYLYYVFRAGWRSDVHPFWSKADALLRGSSGPVMLLSMRPKHLLTELIELRCEVTHPSKVRVEHTTTAQSAQYPDDFPRAPSLTAGTYGVRWLEKREQAWFGRWRERIFYKREVTDEELRQLA